MGLFVWSKMQNEGGQTLASILARKEAERRAGNGVFWWGIGNSLGTAVRDKAKQAGGVLPVLFSQMRTPAKRVDAHPSVVFLWTEWEDISGVRHKIPAHVLEWSRGADGKKTHYALVCRSDEPITLSNHGPFDPSRCLTHLGKRPATRQVTALLADESPESHAPGEYHWGFRATLIEPWVAKLVNPRPITPSERKAFESWKPCDDWLQHIAKTHTGGS